MNHYRDFVFSSLRPLSLYAFSSVSHEGNSLFLSYSDLITLTLYITVQYILSSSVFSIGWYVNLPRQVSSDETEDCSWRSNSQTILVGFQTLSDLPEWFRQDEYQWQIMSPFLCLVLASTLLRLPCLRSFSRFTSRRHQKRDISVPGTMKGKWLHTVVCVW